MGDEPSGLERQVAGQWESVTHWVGRASLSLRLTTNYEHNAAFQKVVLRRKIVIWKIKLQKGLH